MSERDAEPGRERAWLEPASLVVEASAGTGKTSMLINRALWLILVREVPLERLVALAFAEKAAMEMHDRLRSSLRGIVRASSREDLPEAVRDPVPAVSLDTARRRARTALDSFSRAHVTTIHSFAGYLLKLYPVEAGVPPGFRIIEETEASAALAREWERFLSHELRPGGKRTASWRRVLARVRVSDLEALARELAAFRAQLDRVPDEEAHGLHPELASWLKSLHDEAGELASALPPKVSRAASLLAVAREALEAALHEGRNVLVSRAASLSEAEGAGVTWPKKWPEEMQARGRDFTRRFRALRAAAHEPLAREALSLLKDFSIFFRTRLLKRGLVTFDGLLSLALGLLRDRLEVRAELKSRFDAILVDEVQDVDPLQLELLLYLAERPEGKAADWREVEVAAGKLTLVGDPKQSIYGFRHADLKAYQRVMDLALSQGARDVKLATSMRSSESIIAAVNACGEGLFTDASGPPYLALRPFSRRIRAIPGAGRPRVLAVEPAENRTARAAEAEAVAAWIAAQTATGRVRAGDVAVLFPKKQHMPLYADALRRRGVPVSVEEERSFYRRREIAELTSVLRVTADPGDEAALAGFLRSGFAGLDDSQLTVWFERWRAIGGKAGFARLAEASRAEGFPRVLAGTFERLGELACTMAGSQAGPWLEEVFSALAVDALAAASGRPGAGEAAGAFKPLLAGLIREHGVNGSLNILRDCVRAEARAEAPPVRAPSLGAAAPELDAVRVMTIHQAKGLEFPVVVIGDAWSGHRQTRTTEAKFRHDWSSGLAGIVLPGRESGAGIATLEGAYLTQAEYGREMAQDRRVLYVALTRAREELVIPRPIPGTGTRGRGTPSLGELLIPALEGREELFESLPPVREPPPSAGGGAGVRPVPVEIGSEREARRQTPLLVPVRRPSAMRERLEPDRPGTRSASAILGELCHKVLEDWDFARNLAARDLAGTVAREVERVAAALKEPAAPEAMCREAAGILAGFLVSPAADWLKRARILGREVPLVAPVEGGVLSARADVVCLSEGGVVIADYKLGESPAEDGETAALYRKAAQAALGVEARFAYISLKAGRVDFASGSGLGDT